MAALRKPTGRPEPGEYAAYAGDDIALVSGDDAISALTFLAEETPIIFRSLRPLVDQGLSYAPGKWTLKEILGHLIDDERIFGYRILCLARGEALELPGFDENSYVKGGEFETRSLDGLLSEYASVRAGTISLLANLPASAWRATGRVNGYQASVRGLAFHIAGHERHHLRVIEERYRLLAG